MLCEAEMKDLGVLISLFIVENKHNSTLVADVVRETDEVLIRQDLQEIVSDANQLLIVSERDGSVIGALLGNVTNVRERRWT